MLTAKLESNYAVIKIPKSATEGIGQCCSTTASSPVATLKVRSASVGLKPQVLASENVFPLVGISSEAKVPTLLNRDLLACSI